MNILTFTLIAVPLVIAIMAITAHAADRIRISGAEQN